jgi:CubicO group peptidase (beta-lactamase class C family)
MANRSAVLWAALLLGGAAQASPPADIDDYVARAMQTFEAPGLALAIVEGDKTTHAKGYGVRKLGESRKADERTLFPIGSCTKAFTAAALALLVDDGKLGWDDKVTDKLPGFRLYDPYATAELTVRDLLAHRSGLGLGAGDLLWLPATDYSRRQLMHQLRYIKPATSFRSGYAYDNVLYVVAGVLIEQISGQTWENFVQKRILDKLGMDDTAISLRQALKTSNRATPHARIGGEMRGLGPNTPLSEDPMRMESPNIAPAGSIQASAADIARWLAVQINQGAMPGGGRLFSEASAKKMWEPLVIEPPDRLPASLDARKPNFIEYALGWNVTDYRGHKIITHSGAVFGGKAVVVIVPEKRVGIAIMVNSEDGGARWAPFYHLLDHYLGLEPIDWIAKYREAVDELTSRGLESQKKLLAAVAPPDSAPAGPSLPIAKYAGVYRDAWYGTITIKLKNDKLRIQFDHTPAMHGPLEHVRNDTFRTRFDDRNLEDAYVTFALKPDGSIDQMKMQAVSPAADFSFDFQDLLFEPVALSAGP